MTSPSWKAIKLSLDFAWRHTERGLSREGVDRGFRRSSRSIDRPGMILQSSWCMDYDQVCSDHRWRLNKQSTNQCNHRQLWSRAWACNECLDWQPSCRPIRTTTTAVMTTTMVNDKCHLASDKCPKESQRTQRRYLSEWVSATQITTFTCLLRNTRSYIGFPTDFSLLSIPFKVSFMTIDFLMNIVSNDNDNDNENENEF